MRPETKNVRAVYKALDDGAAGTFEAIVSVFGNVDMGGDRMVPGCFARTLDEWKASGDPIPIIWSHDWDNPDSHIGYVLDAAEKENGLWVKAQLDITDNMRAKQVHKLLAARRVREFSFGYFPVKSQLVEEADRTWPVRELLDVDLFETGPTLLGMNPDTELISAASLDAATLATLRGLALPPALADRLAKALDGAPAGESTTKETGDTGSRDTENTIDPERVADLLTRTRYTED